MVLRPEHDSAMGSQADSPVQHNLSDPVFAALFKGTTELFFGRLKELEDVCERGDQEAFIAFMETTGPDTEVYHKTDGGLVQLNYTFMSGHEGSHAIIDNGIVLLLKGIGKINGILHVHGLRCDGSTEITGIEELWSLVSSFIDGNLRDLENGYTVRSANCQKGFYVDYEILNHHPIYTNALQNCLAWLEFMIFYKICYSLYDHSIHRAIAFVQGDHSIDEYTDHEKRSLKGRPDFRVDAGRKMMDIPSKMLKIILLNRRSVSGNTGTLCLRVSQNWTELTDQVIQNPEIYPWEIVENNSKEVTVVHSLKMGTGDDFAGLAATIYNLSDSIQCGRYSQIHLVFVLSIQDSTLHVPKAGFDSGETCVHLACSSVAQEQANEALFALALHLFSSFLWENDAFKECMEMRRFTLDVVKGDVVQPDKSTHMGPEWCLFFDAEHGCMRSTTEVEDITLRVEKGAAKKVGYNRGRYFKTPMQDRAHLCDTDPKTAAWVAMMSTNYT